ncbi:MAG: glycine betaine ABC transporter substrate-binding protein [Egibacteraceae bacterium]
MQCNWSQWSRLLVLLATLTLLLPACGGGGGPTGGGAEGSETVAGKIDLSGIQVTVGSKEFTEQQIVGKMTVLALRAAGASVTDQTGLQGTMVVRQALESSEIDMYWEYTGTGWINILQRTELLGGPQEYYQRIKEADAKNGIVWLEPSQVNNAYAFFIGPNHHFRLKTISDLAAMANENPEQATLCAATEFITRPDGLPGVTDVYGFEFSRVNELDLNLAINAAIEGKQCTVGEIFQTDPQILANDLNVLEDDREFFPIYNLAMTIRQDVYEQNADAYNQLFGTITKLLNNKTMIELNGRVDLEGDSYEDVAQRFLVENGIISG